ncbi:MAG: hypothetical protein HOP08_09360 [Cyclobacteriaceae bacterium]|nr:hypothetical protein [Cyclobacteriaceae bacterium]
MKKLIFITALVVSACTVTFITGYDQIIDTTLTKMKSDFNLHFIKLSRTIQDSDPVNQKFDNFQDYYDHLEVDLITLNGRSKNLGEKGDIVRKQIQNLDSIMHAFENMHKKGIPDRAGDDRRDIRNSINSSFDAVIRLQEELRSSGKVNSK